MPIHGLLDGIIDTIDQSGVDFSDIHNVAELASVLDNLGFDAVSLSDAHLNYLFDQLHHLTGGSEQQGLHEVHGGMASLPFAAAIVGAATPFLSEAAKGALSDIMKETA